LKDRLIKLLGLFHNRNFILALALILGIVLGQGAYWTEKLVIPALGFIMTLSTTSITKRLFRSPSTWVAIILASFVLNFIVLGGLMLLLSNVMMLEDPFRSGFIVLAAVPPAVGVIPFTVFLDGDRDFSLIGTLGSYLASFIVTPLVFFIFLGSDLAFQTRLLITMFELILIPLIISRILIHTAIDARIITLKGTLVNWSFFLIVYTVVGLNREFFLSQPSTLIPTAVITFVCTFLLGYVIERAGLFLGINPKKVTSMVLLGTSKNAGFAAGLTLALFDKQSAIPSAINTIFMILYIITLDLKNTGRKNH